MLSAVLAGLLGIVCGAFIGITLVYWRCTKSPKFFAKFIADIEELKGVLR